MSTELVPVQLSLDTLVKEIRAEHAAVVSGVADALYHAMSAGDKLIAAKAGLAHGAWLPWLADNFVFTQPVAWGYMRLAANRPEVEAQIISGLIISPTAMVKQIAAKRSADRRRASRRARKLPDGLDYRIGDAREIMAEVEDESVALVLTDPPYGDQAEPLYEWLAEWSERVLVPGGSLLCYTGQSRLNRDVAIFDETLRYWWLLAMQHDRSQRIAGKFVVAEFKPILWYVKEHRRGRTLVNDLVSSERDKSAHPWAQGSGGVAFLIENLTEPGELVVDPFAGTGRWGEITVEMGRRWTGCDIEAGGTTRVAA